VKRVKLLFVACALLFSGSGVASEKTPEQAQEMVRLWNELTAFAERRDYENVVAVFEKIDREHQLPAHLLPHVVLAYERTGKPRGAILALDAIRTWLAARPKVREMRGMVSVTRHKLQKSLPLMTDETVKTATARVIAAISE